MHPACASRAVREAAAAGEVGEVEGFAGWLYWDMHDLGSARRHYRIAVEQAQRASGDSMLTAYMLGNLASFVVVQEGVADEGIALIRHAAIVHVQAQEVEEGLRVATAAIDLAATTRSERVLSRARQFRRTIPATVPPGALRDVDEHLRIANTRERTVR